jgi:bacteriocin biosynthesis cyclodehydratase domain-containing protein
MLNMHPHGPNKLTALPVHTIKIEDGVIIKRGCSEIKISGKGAAQVLKTILTATTGSGSTKEEISERFPVAHRPVVNSLIDQLLARRILISIDAMPRDGDGESSLDIFYWHFGDPAVEITGRLNRRRIAVLGVNCISRQLVSSFSASGMESFEIVDDPMLRNLRLFDESGMLKGDHWQASFKLPRNLEEWQNKIDIQPLACLVATSDFGDQLQMRKWNEFCVRNNTQFLPVVLKNLVGYVGPLIVPGETACFECLRARQNSHFEDPAVQRASEDAAFEGQSVAGFHPSMASILGDIAALELTKFYSGVLPSTKVGTMIEVNLLISKMTCRRVLKVPRCSVCSPLKSRSPVTSERQVFGAVSEASK